MLRYGNRLMKNQSFCYERSPKILNTSLKEVKRNTYLLLKVS
ncbi:MAG: hypothetical protein RLZZ381_1539 [Cyanobacteriota bacterium]|jgi:hypothetical protein